MHSPPISLAIRSVPASRPGIPRPGHRPRRDIELGRVSCPRGRHVAHVCVRIRGKVRAGLVGVQLTDRARGGVQPRRPVHQGGGRGASVGPQPRGCTDGRRQLPHLAHWWDGGASTKHAQLLDHEGPRRPRHCARDRHLDLRASARAVRGPSRGTTTAIVGADTQRSSRARGANPTRAPTAAPTHYPGWCRAGTISCNSSHVVHTSASLDGPWTPTTTWVHINGGHLSNENPTPLVLDNGTIMLLINTYMGNACETIAVSEFGWEGPYSVPLWRNNTNGTLEGHAEDGYLYRDVRGHWHALFHFFPKIGGHAFSIDGVAWSNVTYAYNGTIQLAPTSPNNNATVECARRERPSLIFDDKGAPTHLVTGCCVAPCNMSQPHGPGGYSFTSVQPLNTA